MENQEKITVVHEKAQIPESSPYSLKTLFPGETLNPEKAEDARRILEALEAIDNVKNLSKVETTNGEVKLTAAENKALAEKFNFEFSAAYVAEGEKLLREKKQQMKDQFDTSKHRLIQRTKCAKTLLSEFQRSAELSLIAAGVEDLYQVSITLAKFKGSKRLSTGERIGLENTEYFKSVSNPINLPPGTRWELRGMGKKLDPSQIAGCTHIITFGDNGKSLGWKLDKANSTPYYNAYALAEKEIYAPAKLRGIINGEKPNHENYFKGKVILPSPKTETLETPKVNPPARK